MPDSAEVVGDDLVVVHNGETVTLSLAISLEVLDSWIGTETNGMLWREYHELVRDKVMPESARQVILEMEGRNIAFAIELARGWADALSDRLGKSVRVPLYGDTTEQPSPPTSGSDTESTPTEPAPTPQPKSSRRTRSASATT